MEAKRLASAVRLLRHRGPDSRNLLLWDGARRELLPADERADSAGDGFRVGLGHARLSIIDLSESNDQPFCSEDGRWWLTYNGEVYNYLELRQALGGEFRTTGDTEVLLRLLMAQGMDAVRRLNGMWAFALFDAERRRILLSRDRYGKKPLFFHHDGRQFLAASEYKALFEMLGEPRRVEPDYVHGFLLGKRWPVFDDMRSMYAGVGILPAGSCLVYDLDAHSVEIVRNNEIESFLHEADPDPDALPDLLESAVSLRLRSDVPVGVLVSGGVDSTTVAALAAGSAEGENLSFYTIKVDDDDLRYSRRVAEQLGIQLIEVEGTLDDADMDRYLGLLTRQMEVPINVGLVTLPGYLVLRRMAEDGIRVALDGTGGDEVLGGYPGYFHMALENAMRAGLWGQAFRLKRLADQRDDLRRSFLGGWLRFFRRTAFPGRRPPEKMITDSRAGFLGRYSRLGGRADLDGIVDQCFARDRMTDVADMQIYDLVKGQMPYYLYINDQVSMINSVETRSPLLDYRLAPYIRMALRHKLHRGYNKYLLRACLPPKVGDDIRWRMAKVGFGMVLDKDMERRSDRMEEAVRASTVLAGMFDLGALLDELQALRDQSHFRELLEHMYSVALLEDQVPMSL